MSKESVNESKNSLKERVNESELVIQGLSERLIHDLNAGKWEYIERRDCYLKEYGIKKFPNKIAHDMIRAWRWAEVFRHLDNFEPTQTLAKALLNDMKEKWFYEDKENKSIGVAGRLLKDSEAEREEFLSRFPKLDKSTALLVLELLNTNMYSGAGNVYKIHLWDCFSPSYFTGLDEEILKRLSNRWKVIEDEDKNAFIWIDNEKRREYTKIALEIQKKTKKEEDEDLKDLQKYLNEDYEQELNLGEESL